MATIGGCCPRGGSGVGTAKQALQGWTHQFFLLFFLLFFFIVLLFFIFIIIFIIIFCFAFCVGGPAGPERRATTAGLDPSFFCSFFVCSVHDGSQVPDIYDIGGREQPPLRGVLYLVPLPPRAGRAKLRVAPLPCTFRLWGCSGMDDNVMTYVIYVIAVHYAA